MTASHEITTRSGLKLLVDMIETDQQLEVLLQTEDTKPESIKPASINEYLLHWGLRRDSHRQWEIPPSPLWPEGTHVFGQAAVQTPFSVSNGLPQIVIRLARPVDFSSIEFVLFLPRENRWDNNGGENYRIDPRRPGRSPAAALKEELSNQPPLFERVYDLSGGSQLATAVISLGRTHRAVLVTDVPGPVLLHWGIARRSPHEWVLPPSSLQPTGTSIWQNAAAETPFTRRDDGLAHLNLEFEVEQAPLGICFVLRQADTGGWFKDAGGNFFLPILKIPAQSIAATHDVADLADEIISAEMGRNSWTLMHRFNLCYDLLDRSDGTASRPTRIHRLALLFVWLRFSAIRQLDWQRNYNTKPRELSHAQDRLTLKLADVYAREPGSRPLIRLMMTTLGRGGEGQKIRDDILGIMHRYNIKEVAGHFMEEWHQKLHNNTTPDDVVICEAYLAFLRSNGNLDIFYNTLQAGGVTKARLEGFERSIRSAPVFVPHIKEGLIHDFEHFLRTLKSVHSGSDLETAVKAAEHDLDDQMRGLLSSLLQHQGDQQPPTNLASQITEARRRLRERLQAPGGARDLLYLDLALEQLLRTAVERSIHFELAGDQLVELIAGITENVVLSAGEPVPGQNGTNPQLTASEIRLCSAHWQHLAAMGPRFAREWALHAKAVLDRLTRSLAAVTDQYYKLFQDKAELLGNAFHADPWTITIFSEEVIRGGLAFALSLLVRRLNPILRRTAQLSAWQLISRAVANGRVEVVDALGSIQGRRFTAPVLVVTDQIRGDEEIPEGVTAVITSTEPDILSHVAVRARNARVLFATCYDSQILEQLKSLSGHVLRIEPGASGDLVFQEAQEVPAAPHAAELAARMPLRKLHSTAYAVGIDKFDQDLVGAKSLGQARLRGKLPEWIHQPVSVAVPFGVFEKVLALTSNRVAAERYQALVSQAQQLTPKVLSELRQTVLELTAPDELPRELGTVLETAGIASRENWGNSWEKAWRCVKQVWASKWNERAYFSRKTRMIPDESLFMAVLVQQVIPAEYAFVIHTVNPFTGATDELYAEVVPGLGETLVGNYPGRALSFTCGKNTLQPALVAYPSKGFGLYGEGLIFRSDSNGEDLAGYAGAGLYDSVMLNPVREVLLDYSQERLLWQEDFRNDFLVSIARIGAEIENFLGSAQDIEGVYSAGRYYVVQARPQVG